MPLVGTWIEIQYSLQYNCITLVVPLVGTWIEILDVPAVKN